MGLNGSGVRRRGRACDQRGPGRARLLDVGSFDEAVLAIANLGGDADTNAAIYGQLGGAYCGVEAIPASWRNALYEGEQIDALARALVELRLEAPLTRFDEDLQGEAPSV